MATFDINSNVFIKALALNSQSSVLAISTAGKFVDKNISVQITTKNGSASTPATTIAQAPTITLTTATGAITATYTKSQSVTPTISAGWVSSGTAGTISTTGSASIILPASTATISSDTITIAPGWFGATTALTVSAGSASTPATTIAKAPTITVATATGVITAKYNSSQSVTPTIVAGWVTSGTAGTISTTGNQTLTLPQPTVTVTNDTINMSPGWIRATTAYTVASTTVTTSAASVSGTSFTNGNTSWGTGWVTSGSISGATFSNTATAASYLDISNSNGAPILVSDDYLYINKGYTDNVKISLAKLVPNAATITGSTASNEILSGYAAYNSEGLLLIGTIPTKSQSDIGTNANNITIPSGYYADTASLSMTAGAYNAGITLSAITVTPAVSINNASTYGFTTTVPSSGTYITINPGADQPIYSATATATITTAGYLATGNKKTGTSANVQIADGTNYYIRAITPSFSGGNLTASTTNTISTNMSTTSTSSYYIDAIATTTASRAQANYTNIAGVITTHTNATAINATSTNFYSTATRIYIPQATFTSNITGGDLSLNATSNNIIITDNNSYNNNLIFTTTATRASLSFQVLSTSAGYWPYNSQPGSGGKSVGNVSNTYYLQGVTLNKPASGEAKFSLTIPNGVDDMITFVFHVDSSGNVVVNDSTDNAFT